MEKNVTLAEQAKSLLARLPSVKARSLLDSQLLRQALQPFQLRSFADDPILGRGQGGARKGAQSEV
jgi:hypothetical protein